jgi:hypothetical protein
VKVRLGVSQPVSSISMLQKEKIHIVEESHGSGTISVLVIETDLSLDASSGNYEELAVIEFLNDVREYMKAGSSASAFKVISLHKETPAAPTGAEA